MAVGSVETAWSLLPDMGPTVVRFLQLKELVSSWQGPGTLVLVTHDPALATYADRIITLRDGRIAGHLPADSSEEAVMHLAAGS